MTPSELTTRVMVDSAIVLGALAGLAALLGGPSAASGVLVGGGLAVAGFRWLAASALSACAVPRGSSAARWLPWAVLRVAALAAGAGIVLAGGWAHPVAVVAGLTVVPCALIAAGLRGARQEARG